MIKIYINDKTRDNEIHIVEYDPSSGELDVKDHDLQYEQTLSAFGGRKSQCCAFYDQAIEKGIIDAFMSEDVFSGDIRIRIVAEWVKIAAPFYDDLVGKEFKKVSYFEDGSRANVRKMAEVSLKYLDMYLDPMFDQEDPPFDPDDPDHSEYSFDDDYKRNISAMCQPAIMDMINSFPEDRAGVDQFRSAWHAMCAVELLYRAITWLPEVHIPESNAVAVELQKAIGYIVTSIDLRFDEQQEQLGQMDRNSFVLLYTNQMIKAAAKVTKKYIKEAPDAGTV